MNRYAAFFALAWMVIGPALFVGVVCQSVGTMIGVAAVMLILLISLRNRLLRGLQGWGRRLTEIFNEPREENWG
jgi:uncharacterized membrane protein YccC